MEKRLKRVRSYQQARKKGRWFPFVCGALFVCLSAGTIWVAAVGTVDLYERLYQETVVETEEAFRKEALPASGYQGQLADSLSWMVEEPFRAVWLLEWTVEDGELHSTSPFSQQAGESVKVSVSTEPAGQAVRVGIVCPSGELRYIQTSSSVNHAFLAPESGEYRVYVENRSGIPVRVQVSYVR